MYPLKFQNELKIKMNIIHELLNGIWAIDKQVADGHLMIVKSILQGDAPRSAAYEDERRLSRMTDFACVSNGKVHKVSEYGYEAKPENAPEDSVAMISIGGVITKNDQYCGSAGMVTKSELINRCDRNPNIKAIVLKIDSGGGEGYAAMHLQEVIKNTNKPIVAFIDDLAASAAYYIASACNRVVANSDMARIGSIGTYVSMIDYSGALEAAGIKIIEVYASKSNDKNKDYLDAIKGDTKALQESVDVFNERFLADVAKNRDLKSDWKTWGTGKVFFAPDALEIGLIDEIDSFDNVIKSLLT